MIHIPQHSEQYTVSHIRLGGGAGCRNTSLKRTVRCMAGAALLVNLVPGCNVRPLAAGASDSSTNHSATSPHHALPDFVDLVAKVKPAVVSITSRLQVNLEQSDEDASGGRTLPFPFSQFPFNRALPRLQTVVARGSGFVIAPDGTIITNNHVAEGAVSIMVTLDDGSQHPARVVGRDPRTDIVVLKIVPPHPLRYLEFGDSANVRAGEWVVVMGNPFGLGGTATVGIVSALGRDIGSAPYEQFIQVDAPINAGNSGGPLFTQDGEVIGMVSSILSPTGGSVGIGFAIPSNVLQTIVPRLEATGHIVRGFLGVQNQAVTPGLAALLHLPDPSGALVASVEPGSPASRAGVAAGDVIRAVNGQPVGSPRELAQAISSIEPGHAVRLGIVRNGRDRNVDVTVATLPEPAEQTSTPPAQLRETGLGLTLETPSPTLRRQLHMPKGYGGAVVTKVQPGSASDLAGIAPRDVIVRVGTASVDDATEAVRAIQQAAQKGSAILLRVFRDGQVVFVAVAVGGDGKG